MGPKWLISLIGALYLIGLWFYEDQIVSIFKTHVLQEIELRPQIVLSSVDSIPNTMGRTHVSKLKKTTNKHFR